MKTAGTSLELAFAKACGPEDIVARIRPPEPELENRTDIDFEKSVFFNRKTNQKRVLRQHSFLHHAAEVLGNRIAEYRIVTSERNPWTKLQSSFFWKLHHSPKQVLADPSDGSRPEKLQQAFKSFVLSPVADPCDAFDMYAHHWVPLADHVIRFESLELDLSMAARALGLPETVALPSQRAKGGLRPDDVKLKFDAEMDAAVRARFSREIAWFGYDSPDAIGQNYRPHNDLQAWKSNFFSLHKQAGWVTSQG